MNEMVFRFWSDKKDNWFYITLSNYPTYSNEILQGIAYKDKNKLKEK